MDPIFSPNDTAFPRLAEEFDFVPVYQRFLGDTLTPVSALHRLDDGGPVCLFESVIEGEKVGRYSFLAVQPFQRFVANRQTVQRWNSGNTSDATQPEYQAQVADPLDTFRQEFSYHVADIDGLPPFIGGAVGYAAYDVVRYVEDLPKIQIGQSPVVL
ncbi:MAG: anthranilate synthase component I, partial [Planctomycetota bacterium]